MHIATILCATCVATTAAAQSVTINARTARDSQPIAQALVRAAGSVARTGDDGSVTLRLDNGNVTVVVARLGFSPDSVSLALRAGTDTAITVYLAERAAEVESIVIAATRAERRVEDTPLRVEVIDEEEVAEKVAMTPGDIAMMLNETSGLRVQTTSPSLGGANVRIQGLRGRYTLMLADGLPLYGGQGSGLGLLQIPPVDLARAEVIKGTASALYGSAALGGVINLVARRPADTTQRELILNQTSRGGTDGVLYLSAPFGSTDQDERPLGATLLASLHRQRANDLDGDRWADMPAYERAVFRPRFFFDDKAGHAIFATLGLTAENRSGGTLGNGVAPDGVPYVEGLDTRRGDAGVTGRFLTAGGQVLGLRASAVEQRHDHTFGTRRERDRHRTWFAEASAALPQGRWTHVLGAAYQEEHYRNTYVSSFDFSYRVPSLFAQSDVDAASWLVLSASARADWHSEFGSSVNPRVSALLRRAGDGRLAGWSARVSGGTGTFAPVPFTEETEVTGLGALRPLVGLSRERAVSGSIDINGPVETALGGIELNASVFGSRLTDAVLAREYETVLRVPSTLELLNAPVPTRAWGAELLARVVRGRARVTASYAHLRATEWDVDRGAAFRRDVPLAPRHTAGIVASFEEEEQGRVGLELYYTGRQSLVDNPYRTSSRPYLIVGMLGERWLRTSVGVARVFINLENIGNVRQTQFDPLLLPSRGPGGRWTTDAWTELVGFTMNGGVRLSF